MNEPAGMASPFRPDPPRHGTSAAGPQDPTGWGAKVHSVRFRVVAAMLVMMLAGLVTAGLVTFVVQFQESDARVDQAILDKAKAVVKLVQTSKRASGEPPTGPTAAPCTKPRKMSSPAATRSWPESSAGA